MLLKQAYCRYDADDSPTHHRVRWCHTRTANWKRSPIVR